MRSFSSGAALFMPCWLLINGIYDRLASNQKHPFIESMYELTIMQWVIIHFLLFILVSGKGQNSDVDLSIDLDVHRCFYKDCIPPVPSPPPEVPDVSNITGRPDNVLLWSEVETWESLPEGWGSNTGDGSYSGALPQDGEDVMILPGENKLK